MAIRQAILGLGPAPRVRISTSGLPENSGVPPNYRHEIGAAAAIEYFESIGYLVTSAGSTAVQVPGFVTYRVYDFVAQDMEGALVGMEVKTTTIGVVSLRATQVAKDTAVIARGGIVVRTNQLIDRVSYAAYCMGCGSRPVIDFRSVALFDALTAAGIPANVMPDVIRIPN